MKSLNDFPNKEEYHQYLRVQFAMAAMQGLLTSIYSNIPMYQLQVEDWKRMYGGDTKLGDAIARNSIELADCLLEQLEQ